MHAEPIVSNRPTYLQLRDILALRIVEGRWSGGYLLPNESELAREFKVSTSTVRKAMEQLVRENLVVRKQGRGTFVSDRLSETYRAQFDHIRALDKRRFDWMIDCDPVRKVTPQASTIACLELEASEKVYEMRRARKGRNNARMVDCAYVPEGIFPNLEDVSPVPRGIVTLAYQYKLILSAHEEVVRCNRADKTSAEKLGCQVGDSIFQISRIIWDSSGRPIEHWFGETTCENKIYFRPA